MNYLEKAQNDIIGWYEESSVAGFMQWWKYHLKSFVPEKHHKNIFADSYNIFLLPGKDDVQVWYKASELDEVSQVANDGSDESWWHQVQHLINEADGKPVTIDYLVPKSQVLTRKIALPAAAKENLDEVIGFELDKYVPFSPDQVQLSYKIDSRKSNEEKLLLDLVVMPKEMLDSIIKQCDEKSIPLSSIDININSEDSSPEKLGVNLLPREKRKARDLTNLKLNSFLAVVLVGLVYFVMTSSISAKQDKIDQLSEINSELQKQARTSKLLKKDLKEAIVSSQFLNTRQREYKSPVTLLFELTNILPDHTYVTRLRITEEKIEVTGESDNANGLIPKMDKSGMWFSPNFPRAIIPNARTGKEKFTIEAGLHEPEEDENDSAS